MNPINPFKFGSVVSGEYFYDREEELLRVKQTLSGGNNKNRAFYNAASVMTIDTIQEERSITYLIDRFQRSGIQISSGVIQYLLDKVSNIPYYIQFIAHEIWQSAIMNKEEIIDEESVEQAIEQILTLKEDFYWELTNQQTAYRKKILYAISKSGERLFSQKTTKTYDLGATSSTQKALDVLIEEGIIERKKDTYYISDPVYRIFITRNL